MASEGVIIIADGGSSSVQWAVFTPGGEVSRRTSSGINPFILSSEQIYGEVARVLAPWRRRIQNLHFYGTACGIDQPWQRVYDAFTRFAPEATIEVRSDMVGAALACWHHGKGLTAILGTGSNLAYWDGGNMLQITPSLGYILGDEGSGAWIGKRLARDWMYGLLPPEVENRLNSEVGVALGITKDAHGVYDSKGLVERVFNGERPNAFLSSLARYAIDYRDLAYCDSLLREAVEGFVQSFCLPAKAKGYRNLRAVGSIAWFCKDILQTGCASIGIDMDRVVREPLEEMIVHFKGVYR